jgi:hypothetical protein
MHDFLGTIVAGVTGTTLMTLVLTFIHSSGWANADMIRAVGSIITRRYENALLPGLFAHYLAGCVFAFPYVIIMRGTGVAPAIAMPGLGLLLGTFHGVVMSYVMLALVAENHPVERFRHPGFEVAAAHFVAHVAYGLGVGAVVALLGIDFGIRF